MIKAIFSRNSDDLLDSVEISGHAGSGDYGFDVVCAAVSTLSINFINSLEVLTQAKTDLSLNESDGGYMAIRLLNTQQNDEEKIQLLFESFLLGMTNLSENSSEFVQTEIVKR